MRLRTVNLESVAIDDINPDSITPAVDSSGALRLVDGAPVHPLRGVIIRDADGRTVRSSTVRVITPPSALIPALTPLRCVNCTVTPWVADNGRLSISVTADHVEMVEAPRQKEVNHE